MTEAAKNTAEDIPPERSTRIEFKIGKDVVQEGHDRWLRLNDIPKH